MSATTAVLITGEPAGDLVNRPIAYGPDERGVYGVWATTRREAWRHMLTRRFHPPRLCLDFTLPGWLDASVGITWSQYHRNEVVPGHGSVHASTHLGPLFARASVYWPTRVVEHIYPPGVEEPPF